jgi:sporulation protein YlmC with PRC-barrel domain
MAVQDDDNWPADVTVDYVEVTRVGEIVVVLREEVPYLMVEFDIEVVF